MNHPFALLEVLSTSIEYLGAVSFAASGALVGMKKKLDILGVFIIAFASSIGGGTIRDILLGRPVLWLTNEITITIIVATTFITILFRKWVEKLSTPIVFFDTLGVALFAVYGFNIGVESGLSHFSCIVIGTVTAVFGGVVRDILLNELPSLLYSQEIYGTACILGGLLFFTLKALPLQPTIIELCVIIFIIYVRWFAVKKNLRLKGF